MFYNYKHFIKPKWKFFLTIVSLLICFNGILYLIMNSPINEGSAIPPSMAISIQIIFSIGVVFATYQDSVYKGYKKLENEMIDENFIKLLRTSATINISEAYDSLPEFKRYAFKKLLFDLEVAKEIENKSN